MESIENKKYHELAYYTLGLQDDYFIHQHVVDAYTAQTANSDTKAISLTFALVGLYLYIEKNYTGKAVQQFHTLMSNNKRDWPNFKLPQYRGEITIDMVLESNTQEGRNKMIEIWCHAVWTSYTENHSRVKEIAEYYFEIKRTNH